MWTTHPFFPCPHVCLDFKTSCRKLTGLQPYWWKVSMTDHIFRQKQYIIHCLKLNYVWIFYYLGYKDNHFSFQEAFKCNLYFSEEKYSNSHHSSDFVFTLNNLYFRSFVAFFLRMLATNGVCCTIHIYTLMEIKILVPVLHTGKVRISVFRSVEP